MTAEMQAFADVVAQAIETATAPLLARVAVLEKRQLTHGRDGRDAQPVDLDALALKAAALVPRPKDGVDGAQGERGSEGQPGQHGPEGKQGPAGKDGQDAPPVDLDALAVKAAALVPRARDGQNGKDADEAAVRKLMADLDTLRTEWAKNVATFERFIDSVPDMVKAWIPTPRDGTDGKAGIDGQNGRDGVGLSDALIDRDGALVFTFSDGRIKSVGRVLGADGKAGADGQNGRDGSDGKAGADGQNGRDGSDGKAGVDGLGFDDLDAYMDEAKGFVIRFQQADRVKEFPFPMMWDAGVYKPGTTYRKGAGVTAQGSFWIAQADTSERPGDGSTSWRLAVKRGRDGKDGKNGKNGDES